jgi:CHC2 zinc finger
MNQSSQCRNSAIDWRAATDAVKRAVLVPEILRALGARPRGRKRFDCPFCAGSGSQRGTLSVIKDRGWRCFRCGEHGDVMTLVMRLRGCDFVTALKYLTELGRVSLPVAMTPAERRRMQEQERLFKRANIAAVKVEAQQHGLRLYYRDAIHISERLLSRISTQLAALMNGDVDGDEQAIESYWSWLALLWELLQEALVAYSILAFASARTCAQFVMQPAERDRIIAETRMAGHFLDDDGVWTEVLN